MGQTTKWFVALACVFAGACGGAAKPTAAPTAAPTGALPPATASTSTTASPHRPRVTGPDRPSTPTTVAAWRGDTTARPTLENTGTNYVAIFRSLEQQRLWLQAHHPDPALVPQVWVDGTEIARRFRRLLGDLQRQRMRWIDVDDRVDVTVVSVVDHTVSLRVDEHTTGIELVDTSDRVVDTAKQGPVLYLVVLLDRDGTGHWQIASAEERLTNDTEVHL